MRDLGFNVRLLSAGPFVTMIDRFAVAPVLIPIALEFRAPLGTVAIAATAYYLAYGLAQPFWGFASDRAGRIRIIRISLGATSAACALSALAPNLDLLIAARIIAGASVCAILPTALVYVGDMIPFKSRHAVIADLLAAVAVGTAAGSLSAGLFAHYISWRVTFGITAVIAAGLVVAMRSLPESNAQPSRGGPIAQLRQALVRPWARFLILFAIPEGAMVLGFLVYFAPALEATGANPAVAGLEHVVAILLASVLIGGCYAIFHSTMQAWATEIAPEVRGTAAALFVTSAFTGGAIGTGLAAAFAQAHQYRVLFLAGAALSVPVVITAAVARSRYPGSTLADPIEEVAGS